MAKTARYPTVFIFSFFENAVPMFQLATQSQFSVTKVDRLWTIRCEQIISAPYPLKGDQLHFTRLLLFSCWLRDALSGAALWNAVNPPESSVSRSAGHLLQPPFMRYMTEINLYLT